MAARAVEEEEAVLVNCTLWKKMFMYFMHLGFKDTITNGATFSSFVNSLNFFFKKIHFFVRKYFYLRHKTQEHYKVWEKSISFVKIVVLKLCMLSIIASKGWIFLQEDFLPKENNLMVIFFVFYHQFFNQEGGEWNWLHNQISLHLIQNEDRFYLNAI